jgi:hypothetical protein
MNDVQLCLSLSIGVPILFIGAPIGILVANINGLNTAMNARMSMLESRMPAYCRRYPALPRRTSDIRLNFIRGNDISNELIGARMGGFGRDRQSDPIKS